MGVGVCIFSFPDNALYPAIQYIREERDQLFFFARSFLESREYHLPVDILYRYCIVWEDKGEKVPRTLKNGQNQSTVSAQYRGRTLLHFLRD